MVKFDLIKRIVTALILLPIVISVIILGSYLFFISILLLVAFASYEMSRVVRLWGYDISSFWSVVLSVLLTSIIHFNSSSFNENIWLILTLQIGIFTSLICYLKPNLIQLKIEDYLFNIALVIYISGILSHLLLARDMENSINIILFVMLVIFASDTSAFLFGKTLGKRKLAPTISPSKTYEGAIAGVIAASIMALLATLYFELNIRFIYVILLGILIGIIAQIGDILESKFKRRANLTNSSEILPGHGGVLDRLDSVALNLLLLYYFLLWY